MTFPLDIHIGATILPIHLVAELLAFFIGYKYYAYLRKKNGDDFSEDTRWWLIIGAAFGALVGSRLLAALETPYFFIHPPSLIYYYANKTIIGGILGGIIGVEIAKKILGEKRKSGDAFTFPTILGIIIGRIGCFLTGVSDGTVGLASNLPWAFDQGDGIPRHPTSLYEIIFLVILWIGLKFIQKRYQLAQGVLFRLFVIGYCAFRFFVEFLKPRDLLVVGVSSIQAACLLAVLCYGWVILKNRRALIVVK